MRKSKYFNLIILSFLLSGCVSEKILQYEKKGSGKLWIEYKIGLIEINDLREQINPGLYLPPFSYAGQNYINTPPLNEHKVFIREIINNHFSGNGEEVDIVLFLDKGYKEFNATHNYESEGSFVSIRIEVKRENGTTIKCSSNEGFTFKSFDANYKRFERQYRAALSNAIHSCLRQLK